MQALAQNVRGIQVPNSGHRAGRLCSRQALLIGVIAGFIGVMFKVIGTKVKG
jgi:hypothetical protein